MGSMLFAQNVKKIKVVAHKNSDVDGSENEPIHEPFLAVTPI